jgi:predicted ATPase/class 3 adenylate cyclase
VITLLGPGGVGKTTLATAATDRLREGGRRVHVVAAETMTTGVRLLEAIAESVDGPRRASSLDAVAQSVEASPALLFLDNLEQIDGAASAVASLVRRCPTLTVLATSRVPIGVRGEVEVPLGPLALPPPGDKLPPRALATIPAVELFAERCRAAEPDFAVSSENAEVVAELCRRLDGLPLALELCASRIGLLTPDGMLARLERRFELLRDHGGDRPERHRTLEAAIAWSVDLLTSKQRRGFVALGAFAGGFTVAAVEEVVTAVVGIDGLDLIDTLAAASLVRVSEGRASMLESIRAFAVHALLGSADESDVRGAHLAWARRLVLVSAPQDDVSEPRALTIVRAEHDNVRAALAWGVEHDPATALEIAGLLWRFWRVQGVYTEAIRWLEQCLEATASLPSRECDDIARARAMSGLGSHLALAGATERAVAVLEEAIEAAAAAGAPEIRVSALNGLGVALMDTEDRARAEQAFTTALALAKEVGDVAQDVVSLHNLASLSIGGNDHEGSRRMLMEVVGLLESRADASPMTGLAYANLAIACSRLDDIDGAIDASMRSLRAARAAGNRRVEVYALTELGWAWKRKGAYDRAAVLLRRALAIVVETGEVRSIGNCTLLLARAIMALGDLAEAAALFLSVLEDHWDPRPWSVGAVIEDVAWVIATSDPAGAARFFGLSDEVRRRAGIVPPPGDVADARDVRQAVADALGPERLREEEAAGAALAGDDARLLVVATLHRVVAAGTPAVPAAGVRRLIAVLVVDLIGSTEMAASLDPDAWTQLVERLTQAARACAAAAGGRIARWTGDGAVILFARADAACECALDLIARLDSAGLDLRGGVHVGEADASDTRGAGRVAQIADRVGACAPGASLALSASAAAAIGEASGLRLLHLDVEPPPGVSAVMRVERA